MVFKWLVNGYNGINIYKNVSSSSSSLLFSFEYGDMIIGKIDGSSSNVSIITSGSSVNIIFKTSSILNQHKSIF